MYSANIFISKAIRTTREMITKRISGQQKQPGSFILQPEPLSRLYPVSEYICRIYNMVCLEFILEFDEDVVPVKVINYLPENNMLRQLHGFTLDKYRHLLCAFSDKLPFFNES